MFGRSNAGKLQVKEKNSSSQFVNLLTNMTSFQIPHLSQRRVLHRDLTEEEVHVVSVVDGVQEVRLCRGGGQRGRSASVCDSEHVPAATDKTLLFVSPAALFHLFTFSSHKTK